MPAAVERREHLVARRPDAAEARAVVYSQNDGSAQDARGAGTRPGSRPIAAS